MHLSLLSALTPVCSLSPALFSHPSSCHLSGSELQELCPPGNAGLEFPGVVAPQGTSVVAQNKTSRAAVPGFEGKIWRRERSGILD